MISAGVIAANFYWKAKKRISGIVEEYVELILFTVKPFRPTKERLPITPPTLGLKTRL
jgi:hypothetical protein